MKLKYIIPMLLLAGAVSSCEDMMDLEPGTYVFEEDHKLDSANDSLYSAMGILTQLQKIGERYVLLGELRGDMMTVTTDANSDLQEISSFNISDDNAYNSRRDYYSIINNCNYALARMDTSITEHMEKVMMPEYTAIRTMRAWTYLQMGLTYGKVRYVTEPVLSLEDSQKEYPEIGLDQLVTTLADDLQPYVDNNTPNYGQDDNLETRNFFISPKLLLADLYLYQNSYAEAARLYYEYIYDRQLTMSPIVNVWTSNQAVEGLMATLTENNFNESILSEIPYSSEARRIHPNLINLSYNKRPCLLAASWWVNDMDSKEHFHMDNLQNTSVSGYLEGDLRAHFLGANDGAEMPVAVASPAILGSSATDGYIISKYYSVATQDPTLSVPDNTANEGYMTRHIPLYRVSHIYLRYAEALNRLGKHTMAFAVLKHGLRREVVNDSTKIDLAELVDAPQWMIFDDDRFANNYGSAIRGRGYGISLPQSTYVIPEFDTEQETTEWIEEAILEEMAAETQFEGNRFFDLLRVSRHRGGSAAFVAEKLSRRFDDREGAKTRLSDPSTWWLK